ncbi:MAG: virulence protein RhuM/Fic/DOC family protein [Porphyromonadaceae bacterium]|nr:virulence protein RhuM/Fic/DOC family protein [Porphyromonadaceae bacterium]
MNKGEIILYKTSDGQTAIDVRMEEDTVWLTQAQIAELFGTKRPAITKHIKNIYFEGELSESITCSILEHMGNENKQRYRTKYYNLDAILSIGYRVNSKSATQFRIWANKILKEYLVKGYAVNQQATNLQLDQLKSVIGIISKTLSNKVLTQDETSGLMRVVNDYTYGLDTLDKYDFQTLDISGTRNDDDFRATYDNAMEAIQVLKNKFGGSSLFANEKDQSFRSSIGQIYQTFDGRELYPSIEEKAAMLLYLVVKNHSFSDGNKRIAAFLFLWFLDKNGILYKSNGMKLIENNTLVALTLMIAESRTQEKDMMVKVVVNLINKDN